MKRQWAQLAGELKRAGAGDSELDGLVSVAAGLAVLKNSPPSLLHAPRPHLRSMFAKISPPAAIAAGVGLIIVLVTFSQSVLPTDKLYPIQRLSDKVAVAIHPDYRATVMMRRARQVKRLVSIHAQPKFVLTTLDDYNSVAAAYTSTARVNYEAFEYCKTNLLQAANASTPHIRKAILDSLGSLQNV